jgi:hypothetical protein
VKGTSSMATSVQLDRATILRTVRSWPDDEQLRLVQDVLESIRTARTAPRRSTLAEARGLLKTQQHPPSDTEIQQWLDERRMERYGT